MTLTQYYDLLEKHDWYYEMAEGPSYFKGAESLKIIVQESKRSESHRSLFEAYYRYMSRGNSKTNNEVKPARPAGN